MNMRGFRYGGVNDGDFAWREFQERLASLADLSEPGFLAQMGAPPHPAAQRAYIAVLARNPNNHDRRFAAATIAFEEEAVAALAGMLGLSGAAGRLTGGGAVANLEGLWHCRQACPDAMVAVGADAHFIHARNCRLMGVERHTLPCDAAGRIDLDRLEDLLRSSRIGTVVASLGTPGFGAVDPLHELVALKRRHGFTLHVDASYGGFFALLKDEITPHARAAFDALPECDAIAIDPHKLAYQPYGCGCILFPGGECGPFVQDSPYTDCAPEAGIECSRPGAAAGALWLTLRQLPLCADTGLGPVLRACRTAALHCADWLSENGFVVPVAPELSILAFHPRPTCSDAAELATASRRLITAAEAHGIYLSRLRLDTERLGWPEQGETELARAVFMKAAQLDFLPTLYAVLAEASGAETAASRSSAARVVATS